MRTVDDYAKFRTAHRDGMTIRQIARSFHVSRRKVRDALASPQPTPYTRASAHLWVNLAESDGLRLGFGSVRP